MKRFRSFKVQGLDCAEEITLLKREVGPVVGGEDRLSFDLLNGKMLVSEGAPASSEAILQAIARTGMRAELWREGTPGPSRTGRRWFQLALLIASGLLAVSAFGVHAWGVGGLHAALGSEGLGHPHDVPRVSQVLYLLGIIAASWFIAPKAWLSARRIRPDMNLLMLMAVVGAITLGEWFEAATVSFLFALSAVLEAWSIHRARRAVEALLGLTPPTVHAVEGDHARDLPAEAVPVGTPFVVKPGERVPLDGQVRHGFSTLDQAPITGESLPVAKGPGDEVFAGSINGDGTLTVEATRPAGDTILARIIRLIGEAHTKRSPSEQWVDHFARIYTPMVMALALLVALVPPILLGGGWSAWLYRALVLLVIACPCALVISTPVSIVAGLAAAAHHGVLIKGGMHLEAIAHLKAMAFDKTGTLTEGRPRVVGVEAFGAHTKEEVLRIAAAMESQSGHPLAHAILAHARQLGIPFGPAQDFKSFQGKGATAWVDGRAYWLGSHLYLEELDLETPDLHALLEARTREGRTVVVLGTNHEPMGLITLTDPVRLQAPDTLNQLRRAGVKRVVMLTGDNAGTAAIVGRLAGVDDVRSELLPEAKVAAVESLVVQYHQVAMVGDGVNDAPAMARATLGIAMGAMGSDAAIETADIALMNDDLTRLPWLVGHARRTLRVIRQNIVFALAVKAIFVLLTLAGQASLWSAIAADLGASLLVTFNGLRLLRS